MKIKKLGNYTHSEKGNVIRFNFTANVWFIASEKPVFWLDWLYTSTLQNFGKQHFFDINDASIELYKNTFEKIYTNM